VAKGPDAFRTISEAADELSVPQHVLRFWETRFSFIRPMKRAGGRRFYRPQDIAVLRGVKTLLHEDGFTIKGVQRLHKEEGLKRLLSATPGMRPPVTPAFNLSPDKVAEPTRERLMFALDDLMAAKRKLDGLLRARR
jgi:DNA-binding transcriptional MerR regulator